MADNNVSLSPIWIVLLAIAGPVAAGLILDYLRERRRNERMLEN